MDFVDFSWALLTILNCPYAISTKISSIPTFSKWKCKIKATERRDPNILTEDELKLNGNWVKLSIFTPKRDSLVTHFGLHWIFFSFNFRKWNSNVLLCTFSAVLKRFFLYIFRFVFEFSSIFNPFIDLFFLLRTSLVVALLLIIQTVCPAFFSEIIESKFIICFYLFSLLSLAIRIECFSRWLRSPFGRFYSTFSVIPVTKWAAGSWE